MTRNMLSTNKEDRRGTATVELAVCLPMMMLIVFGAIETCSLIHLQQSAQTIAYETARAAVSPRTTTAFAVSRGQQVAADREITGATIELTPSEVANADRGSDVLVLVAIPLAQNRVMRTYLFGDHQLQARVKMMRE